MICPNNTCRTSRILIGYKIKPRWTLHAGYRYLGVDYRSGGFLFNVITSGAVVVWQSILSELYAEVSYVS